MYFMAVDLGLPRGCGAELERSTYVLRCVRCVALCVVCLRCVLLACFRFLNKASPKEQSGYMCSDTV